MGRASEALAAAQLVEQRADHDPEVEEDREMLDIVEIAGSAGAGLASRLGGPGVVEGAGAVETDEVGNLQLLE
ncbi:hypothetical protein [Pseudorhizobium endolithicum]